MIKIQDGRQSLVWIHLIVITFDRIEILMPDLICLARNAIANNIGYISQRKIQDGYQPPSGSDIFVIVIKINHQMPKLFQLTRRDGNHPWFLFYSRFKLSLCHLKWHQVKNLVLLQRMDYYACAMLMIPNCTFIWRYNMPVAKSMVEGCINHVHQWLTSNRLRLNPDKTEGMWCVTSWQTTSFKCPSFQIGQSVIQPTSSVLQPWRSTTVRFDNQRSS